MVHTQRKLLDIPNGIQYFDCATAEQELSEIIKYKHDKN